MDDLRELSDAELVIRAQKGEVEAVGALYDTHQQHIYRYVWSRVGHHRTAEDLTGDTFVKMLAHLPNYRDKGTPFRAWIYRIAHNLIIDYFRKQNGREHPPLYFAEEITETMDEPNVVLEEKLETERIKMALGQIDDAQREVVLLRFVFGLSLKEVAHSLDKSVAAVKSLQHRGLKALRAEMRQEATI